MPKESDTTKTQTSSKSSGAAAVPAPPLQREQMANMINLIEIRPGLFLNGNHIISVRVLSQEEDNVYAILHLSNGDKLNITRDEFTTISGEEPCLPTRPSQKPLANSKRK